MDNYYHKYMKYKSKYLKQKENIKIDDIRKLQLQIGGNGSDMIKLNGITPDLYIPKDVAIVGSAPSLLESDHTNIDNHACVIRVNCNALHDDFYKATAGSRCDIFIFSVGRSDGIDIINKPEYKNSKIICMPDMEKYKHLLKDKDPKLIYWFDTNSPYWCMWSVKNCLKIHNIDDDIKQQMSNPDRRSWSTTGLLTIMTVISSGIKPTIYGFSNNFNSLEKHQSLGNIFTDKTQFTNTKFSDNKKKYNGNHTKDHHDLEGESRIINKLIDNSIIKFKH